MLIEHAKSNVFEESSHVSDSIDLDNALVNLDQEPFRSVLARDAQVYCVALNIRLFFKHLLVRSELTGGHFEDDFEHLA